MGLWHLLHIDLCFIIHDLCFSSSLLDSKSFHSRAGVDFNSVFGMLPVLQYLAYHKPLIKYGEYVLKPRFGYINLEK